jgi:hypothetical protein
VGSKQLNQAHIMMTVHVMAETVWASQKVYFRTALQAAIASFQALTIRKHNAGYGLKDSSLHGNRHFNSFLQLCASKSQTAIGVEGRVLA